ncbi:hypothetical protein [uncultured Treponema sp.]|nr:hypothetical protein [uncultured Treponema sp.]
MSKLSKDSVALVHQIITVDKFRLGEKISNSRRKHAAGTPRS